MANTSKIRNLLFPFWNPDSDHDRLLSSNYILYIENFPPSAVDASPERHQGLTQAQTGTQYGFSAELNEILEEPSDIIRSGSRDEFAAWIDKCHFSKVNIDIDRISRFALFHSNIPVVKYLVKTHSADLKRRDIYGRSAIFYLPKIWVHGMFTFLSPHLCEESGLRDLNHQDRTQSRRTPLYYALLEWVSESTSHKIEYLLANNADINIQDSTGKTSKDLIFSYQEGLRDHVRPIYQILHGFSQLLQQSKHLHFAAIRSNGAITKFTWEGLQRLQNDLKVGPNVFGMITRNNLRKFQKDHTVWYHLPFTNGVMIFAAIRGLAQQFGISTSNLSTDINFIFQRQLASRPSYMSYYRNIEPFDKTNSLRTLINFPYLRLGTRGEREQLLKKTDSFRARFLGQEQAQSRGQNLPDTFITIFAKNAIHAKHTLDETYYPGLPATAIRARNEDQVVFREWVEMQKQNGKTIDKSLGPVLTVPQLWLWRFGDHIITACPLEDLTDYNKCPRWLKSIGYPFPNAAEIKIPLIIAHHISQFGRLQANGLFSPPLDIFETGVVRVLSDVQQYTNPHLSLPPDVNKERDFMHRIADIREELAMIVAVLDQQQEIVENMARDFESFESKGIADQIPDDIEGRRDRANLEQGRMTIRDSLLEIGRHQKRANKIDRDAERIEKVIQDQLNLKRTYATIRDTRNGLVLSAAVIGFTITTIFFAPIAFMTSLFALPLDGLLRNQIQFNPANGGNPTAAYTLTYVGTWFAVAEVVSLVVTAALVALCLWLFGGLENFSVLQQLRFKKSATRSGTTDEDRRDEKDENTSTKGKDDPENETRSNNIRKRAVRLFKFGSKSKGLEDNLVSGALA